MTSLLLCLVTAAQVRTQGADSTVRPNRPEWFHGLITSLPRRIVVDPGHPEYELFIYEDRDPNSAGFGTKLCWMRLPRSSTTLQVSDVRRSGPSSAIYESLEQERDLVVTNGGFFGYGNKNDYLPEGLVIANGKVTSPIKKWSSGGVVARIHDASRVLSLKAFDGPAGVAHAIQSKPMLVQGGKIAIKSDSKSPFNRTAVAVDKNGDVIIAGAFDDDGDAVTLIEFSQFLAMPRSKGGPDAMDALNLDGSTDAHFYLPKIRMHLGYGGQNYVPNAIHFSLK